ncbi:MAG: hypothetical protein GXP41_10555 [Chloroflexi bacterium]|nr:hypothetical protein [Chloroflexota bacterium]
MSSIYPPYIFGLHDPEGEQLMLDAGRPGWVLITEGIGADPQNYSGGDYQYLADKGLGVIVRLNYGYGDQGTLPVSGQYTNFAKRCGNFVAASRGCHVWVIGNEMNLANERPGGPQGETITPARYAKCYLAVRRAIQGKPGHGQDQVIVGAVGPWNTETTYPGNSSGDWILYFRHILERLEGHCDGFALHAYTHGSDPNLIYSEQKMDPPFENRNYHFRTYRDFLEVVPDAMRSLPVYITETDQYGPWHDSANGWVRNAYGEIDAWNKDPDHQPIQALILYRWPVGLDQWGIANKQGVIDDFRAAMQNAYRVRPPGTRHYWVDWIDVPLLTQMSAGETKTVAIKVRNSGDIVWTKGGAQPFHLGYRWYTTDGKEVNEEDIRTPLPRSRVEKGRSVTFPEAQVRAPAQPGNYILRWDMIHEQITWFYQQGSPRSSQKVKVVPSYQVTWVQDTVPEQMESGKMLRANFVLRNAGTRPWPAGGDHPVHLGYRWFQLDGRTEVLVKKGLRTPLPRDVAPGEEVQIEDAGLYTPDQPGTYLLRWDLVKEGQFWFADQQAAPWQKQISIQAQPRQVQWLAPSTWPKKMVAGEIREMTFLLRNIGSRAWAAAGRNPVHLAYNWFTPDGQLAGDWDTFRASLPLNVNLGQQVTITPVYLKVPTVSGEYILRWDLVEEGITWFSQKGSTPLEVGITVAKESVVRSHWSAEASHNQADVPLAFDGKSETAWSSQANQGPGMWFKLDMGTLQTIDRIQVTSPGRGYPYHYAISVSRDGESWQLVHRTPKNWMAIDARFSPTETRFIRIDVLEGPSWGAFWAIGEINVALSDPWADVSASHYTETARLAVDSNIETAWSTRVKQGPDMWFEVDMGRVQEINGLYMVCPAPRVPRGYVVATSVDGTHWSDVVGNPNNWSDTLSHEFSPRRARYVRVTLTRSSPYHPWAIAILAIGKPNPSWLTGAQE